jgi:sarcosine oxidase subunit beta
VNKPVANESDVLIIGGGLHGSSSAFHIARRGVNVTVLEADYVGRHASGVNAGGVRTLGRPLPEIPLALMSREIWHNIVDTIGDDCRFRGVGPVEDCGDRSRTR